MITFTVHGEPTGKGRPKIVSRKNMPYPIAITPDKTRAAEQSFLAQALPYKPAEPLQGPLCVVLTLHCGIPASWSRRKRVDAITRIISPTGKPDVDNVVKLVLDAMNGVFYLDDKQVVELHASKYYSDVPRIEVSIEECRSIV
jgi:Holliday junction resolvase RusA-like endonuclease